MKTNRIQGSAHFVAIGIAVLLLAGGCAATHNASNPVHGPTFNGTVQGVDIATYRLTIAPLKESPPVIFLWNQDSKFWATGLRIEPRQLQTGDLVRIHFIPDSEPKTVQHLYLQTHRTIH